MQNVLITAPGFDLSSESGKLVLEEAGLGYTVVKRDQVVPMSELMARIPYYDALIVGSEHIDEPLLTKSRLLVISKHGVGIDNINISAASRLGIIVTHVPGELLASAVAEFTVAMLLSLMRHIPLINCEMRAGKWRKLIGHSFSSCTLGVIGMGKIGKEVARRARALGMAVIAWDSVRDFDFAQSYSIAYVDFEELLVQSDAITLHIPLTDETRYLIGREQLAAMRHGSYLVNTGRGGLVDEQALYEFLSSGHLAGAALDTFEREPPTGSPLLTLSNVISTPHCAAYTPEALSAISRVAAQNVVAALRGKPQNVCGR